MTVNGVHQFTQAQGHPVWLVVSEISAWYTDKARGARLDPKDSSQGHCTMLLVGGEWVLVRESVDAVHSLVVHARAIEEGS